MERSLGKMKAGYDLLPSSALILRRAEGGWRCAYRDPAATALMEAGAISCAALIGRLGELCARLKKWPRSARSRMIPV